MLKLNEAPQTNVGKGSYNIPSGMFMETLNINNDMIVVERNIFETYEGPSSTNGTGVVNYCELQVKKAPPPDPTHPKARCCAGTRHCRRPTGRAPRIGTSLAVLWFKWCFCVFCFDICWPQIPGTRLKIHENCMKLHQFPYLLGSQLAASRG